MSALAAKGSRLCVTAVASVPKAVLFSRNVERSSGWWRGVQQLDMESNGKRVTMGGNEAPVSTRAIGFARASSINSICCCIRVVFSSRRSLASRSHSIRRSLRGEPTGFRRIWCPTCACTSCFATLRDHVSGDSPPRANCRWRRPPCLSLGLPHKGELRTSQRKAYGVLSHVPR